MPDDESGKRVRAYQGEITADIEACVSQMGCQPILFVGSGLSKRYFAGPSWDELLTHLGRECPLIDKDYAYYKQTLKTNLLSAKSLQNCTSSGRGPRGRTSFPPICLRMRCRCRRTSITPGVLAQIGDKN